MADNTLFLSSKSFKGSKFQLPYLLNGVIEPTSHCCSTQEVGPLFIIVCVCYVCSEKAMATHSSTLAWKIPGTAEPGGLPSMGSHRVGHNWSDLAAAAAICAESLQSCPTLSNPMDCSPPGSSVHGILQPRILEWVAKPSFRGIFPTQGSNPCLFVFWISRMVLYH